MTVRFRRRSMGGGVLLAVPLLVLLALPLFALLTSTSPAGLAEGLQHPAFAPALWLSLRTSLLAVLLIVLFGSPLAWWLAHTVSRWARPVQLLVDIPIVLPPAVVGLALLVALGRQGVLGGLLAALGVSLPFSTSAVILAQVIIAAPFYVHAATAAFARTDEDLMLVARTLGQSPGGAFFRVALPLALPGLLGGVALCWARALGEFGATLLFAGNRPGVTQTMPLAIYNGLETSVQNALALAWALAGVSVVLLLAVRLVPGRTVSRGWGP